MFDVYPVRRSRLTPRSCTGLDDLLGLRPEYRNVHPAYKHNAVAILSRNTNRINAISIDLTKLRDPGRDCAEGEENAVALDWALNMRRFHHFSTAEFT